MLISIALLQFNNISNNIIKRYNTLAEYSSFIRDRFDNINFNPNDGVQTELIIGTSEIEYTPDYLIVYNISGIQSRWFVQECIRTRQGQYKLLLVRDCIADYYNEILNSNCYIQRGYVEDTNNLIFNNEGFNVNEIKNRQILLKATNSDASLNQTPWIVMYLTRYNSNLVNQDYKIERDYVVGTVKHKVTCNLLYSNKSVPPLYDTVSRTEDAPYEIVVAPFNDIVLKEVNIDGTIIPGIITMKADIQCTRAETLKTLAQFIAKYANEGGGLIDVQLVPYCPLSAGTNNYDYWTKNYRLFTFPIVDTRGLDGTLPEVKYDFKGCFFGLKNANFSLECETSTTVPLKSFKLGDITDRFKLVSPNGVGEYEWSPYMNRNSGNDKLKFSADCTLKPFTPYIRVQPIFNTNGLYGNDYHDYRGLICNGNFSLPLLNSQWAAYENNNKNYQIMFNREIETQQRSNQRALINEAASAATGTLSAAATGAAIGSVIPGIGTAIGAGIGGLASLGGGIADITLNNAERNDRLDLSIKQHNSQLQNIQSRAMSLTRPTSFDIDNKLFPYIEIYSCSNEERTAVESYLNFYDYTINVMGKPVDYLKNGTTFMKADLLNIDIKEDGHMVNTIRNILEGGIRIEYTK